MYFQKLEINSDNLEEISQKPVATLLFIYYNINFI